MNRAHVDAIQQRGVDKTEIIQKFSMIYEGYTKEKKPNEVSVFTNLQNL